MQIGSQFAGLYMNSVYGTCRLRSQNPLYENVNTVGG